MATAEDQVLGMSLPALLQLPSVGAVVLVVCQNLSTWLALPSVEAVVLVVCQLQVCQRPQVAVVVWHRWAGQEVLVWTVCLELAVGVHFVVALCKLVVVVVVVVVVLVVLEVPWVEGQEPGEPPGGPPAPYTDPNRHNV